MEGWIKLRFSLFLYLLFMGKRRSKEEAAAAKAEYLKQKAIRDQVRAEKKAKREQMAKERLERKAAREKRRQMTEGERAKARRGEDMVRPFAGI